MEIENLYDSELQEAIDIADEAEDNAESWYRLFIVETMDEIEWDLFKTDSVYQKLVWRSICEHKLLSEYDDAVEYCLEHQVGYHNYEKLKYYYDEEDIQEILKS